MEASEAADDLDPREERMPTVDIETLELVSALYDCVIEPARWQAALEMLRRRFHLHNTVLAVNWFRRKETNIFVSAGIPGEYLARLPGYEFDVLRLWGGPARIAELPLEEPIVQSDVTDPIEWADNPYVRDWVSPQGMFDAVGIGLERDQTMVANLAGGRHRSQGRFTEAELQGMRFIAPHLRRAVLISGLLETSTSTAATFEATLDASAAGIVLVDAAMSIVHANRTAESMLASGDPIVQRNGMLELRLDLAPGHLQSAVATAAHNEAAIGRRGIAVPTRWRDGAVCVVHVLPLQRGQRRSAVALSACAAIFVAPASGPIEVPRNALSLLYALTPAETRVFELSVEGRTVPQIAAQLGVSAGTAKTHLLHVFDKTGHHRQADLVKLAGELTLPL